MYATTKPQYSTPILQVQLMLRAFFLSCFFFLILILLCQFYILSNFNHHDFIHGLDITTEDMDPRTEA